MTRSDCERVGARYVGKLPGRDERDSERRVDLLLVDVEDSLTRVRLITEEWAGARDERVRRLASEIDDYRRWLGGLERPQERL